jgi:hypothetical protein
MGIVTEQAHAGEAKGGLDVAVDQKPAGEGKEPAQSAIRIGGGRELPALRKPSPKPCRNGQRVELHGRATVVGGGAHEEHDIIKHAIDLVALSARAQRLAKLPQNAPAELGTSSRYNDWNVSSENSSPAPSANELSNAACTKG